MDVHDLRSVGPLAVIVMGVSGSGKSTLAAALAGAIRCPFLEGDEFHSPQAVQKMREGDIDLRHGRVGLRGTWPERMAGAIDFVEVDRDECRTLR